MKLNSYTVLMLVPLLWQHSVNIAEAQTTNPKVTAATLNGKTVDYDIQTYHVTYVLADGNSKWPPEIRKRIIDSMDYAEALFNQVGEFDKQLWVTYSPGTPTADGSYNGSIRFGGSISRRVALHELEHVLGVGTYDNWPSFVVGGKWTGAYAIAQLHALDGPDAVLYADHQHFWPYGLNYDNESSPVNDRRHILMVAALRRDMGIVNGVK